MLLIDICKISAGLNLFLRVKIALKKKKPTVCIYL